MSFLGIYSMGLNGDIQIAAESVLVVDSQCNSQLVALFILSCSRALARWLISAPKALQQ